MIAKSSLFALAKALEGIPVLGALGGTPAARAGIRYGDVLLSVNGKRTRTMSDFIEAKALRSDAMDVVVFRAGREETNELRYDEPGAPVDVAAILAELVTLRVGAGGLDEGGGSSAE
ncbi:MAG: PDZ domain-containing protein [Labilithrix sp.]|nr:PDZ domain-containing protein [Labilithrix sp.]MCW5813013.1 PDZ domain-containing protein [Labilithrix sp.]